MMMLQKNWIALQTILRKEIIRFMRIWMQTLLPPAITITLYFIIFGKLIGSQIANISGFTYMQYIVPGLIMMSVITNAYANTSASFFGTKFSRSIEEMLVSSMPSYIILLGYMLSGALRGILVGIIVFFIAALFTHIPIRHISVILVFMILSSLIFSLGGLLNGLFAKKFDDISFVPTFVLTPLTYLGGVFFSIHQLPPFWQKVSLLNPIFAIVDGFRYGLLGIADINVYIGFTILVTLFIILALLCLTLLQKGLGLRS